MKNNTQSHRPKTPQVSIRGSTYRRLREYCRQHGTQVRTVVDSLVLQLLDNRDKGAK